MHPAGFVIGLLHGIFVVPLFIASFLGGHLFGHHWVVYNLVNDHHWYDFGFLIGLGSFGSSVARSGSR